MKRTSHLNHHAAPWLLMAGSVLIIVYGSLFPFSFSTLPRPVSEFWTTWQPWRNWSDAVDNLLLFMPLGVAVHFCFSRPWARWSAALFLLLLLGVLLQWAQLYLPGRVASLSDTIWNTAGVVLGILTAQMLWQWLAPRIMLQSASASYFSWVLLLLWFAYEAFPFLPTLDLGLLREHLKVLFTDEGFNFSRFFQHVGAATLVGIAAYRAPFLQEKWLNVLFLGATALTLETVVAYGGLRRETLLAIPLGMAGGAWVANRSGDHFRFWVWPLSLALLAFTVVTPYRGQVPGGAFTLTPFSEFFWQTRTREFPSLAFEALALAGLCWAATSAVPRKRHGRAKRLAGVLVLAMVMELLRVQVFGWNGDSSLVLMAAFLALAAHSLRNPAKAIDNPQISTRRPPQASNPRSELPKKGGVALTVVMVAMAICVLSRLPGVPYNVREAVAVGPFGMLSALGLAMALLLSCCWPLWQQPDRLQQLPVWLGKTTLVSVVVFALIWMTVPLESIDDVVGSPVLGWPRLLEYLGRFTALHFSLELQVIGAAFLVQAAAVPGLGRRLLWWAAISLLFSRPLYQMVVVGAGTDNLTELMESNASWAAASSLALALFFTALAGSAFGAAMAFRRHTVALALMGVMALPVAAWLGWAGTIAELTKYGQTFSGLQFLFSPNRNQYLQGASLYGIYALALFLVSVVIAILQCSAWKTWMTAHLASQTHLKTG